MNLSDFTHGHGRINYAKPDCVGRCWYCGDKLFFQQTGRRAHDGKIHATCKRIAREELAREAAV